MSEKQTLSRWLRSKQVYQASAEQESEPKSSWWRDELLAEFDEMSTNSQQKAVLRVVQSSPLEAHHLLLMLPMGLVLFALGWLFGSHTISMEQIANLSPWVWVGVSLAGSTGFMLWRGQIAKINFFK